MDDVTHPCSVPYVGHCRLLLSPFSVTNSAKLLVRDSRVLSCRNERPPARNRIPRQIVTCPLIFINRPSQRPCDFSLFPSLTTYAANMSTQPLQAILEQIPVTVFLGPSSSVSSISLAITHKLSLPCISEVHNLPQRKTSKNYVLLYTLAKLTVVRPSVGKIIIVLLQEIHEQTWRNKVQTEHGWWHTSIWGLIERIF